MSTQTEPIRGKVARILNSREVALNIGKEHGVESGMLFDILSPNGLPIEDPDTDEVLGSVDLPKVRVKINRVYDRVSVATTYRTKRVNVGGLGLEPGGTVRAMSRSLFAPPKWETRYETLKIKEPSSHVKEDSETQDDYITRGDIVVQTLDDDS